jgi:hypothetical protein
MAQLLLLIVYAALPAHLPDPPGQKGQKSECVRHWRHCIPDDDADPGDDVAGLAADPPHVEVLYDAAVVARPDLVRLDAIGLALAEDAP